MTSLEDKAEAYKRDLERSRRNGRKGGPPYLSLHPSLLE